MCLTPQEETYKMTKKEDLDFESEFDFKGNKFFISKNGNIYSKSEQDFNDLDKVEYDDIHKMYFIPTEQKKGTTNDLDEANEPFGYSIARFPAETKEDFIERKKRESHLGEHTLDSLSNEDFISNDSDDYKDFQSPPITEDMEDVERIDKKNDFLDDSDSPYYIETDYGESQNDGTNLKMNFEIPKMSKTPVTIAETKAKMKKLKAEIRDLKAIYPIIEESDSPERFDNILHAISSRKEELARLNEIVLGGDMDSKEEKKKETEDDPDEDDEESIKKKKSKNKDEESEEESEKEDEDLIGLHEINGKDYWIEENGDFYTVLIEQGTGDVYKKDFMGNINS